MGKLGFIGTVVGGMILGATALVGAERHSETITELVSGREAIPKIDESNRPIQHNGLQNFSGVDYRNIHFREVCGIDCQYAEGPSNVMLFDGDIPYAVVRNDNRLYVAPLDTNARADHSD
tara:strand:+ start:1225 stop:1584 length:360 start_codon:yes stop_codon:yes gene_type:complete